MSNHPQINPSNTALEVQGLRAGYGDLVVLHGIDFKVESSRIRIILGGSGCGKSTLLNNILGLEKAFDGTVSFFGQKIQAGVTQIPRSVRERCGVLFQNGALLSSLTVAANVALPLRTHRPHLPDSVIWEMVAQKLASVSMLHAWHRLPSELSGGMRKRAALARALVLDPGLLFCDEPSAGLDPVTSRSLDDLLLQLRADLGISMLVVTHELDSIRTIADDILYLSQGRVLFDGPLAQGMASSESEMKNFFGRLSVPPALDRKIVSFQMNKESAHGNH